MKSSERICVSDPEIIALTLLEEISVKGGCNWALFEEVFHQLKPDNPLRQSLAEANKLRLENCVKINHRK